MQENIPFKDTKLKAEFAKYAKMKHFAKDEVIIFPGSKVVYVPIVAKGSIRVIREDEDGREVFLYHLFPGQTCAMSLNCCQAHKVSMIKAIAEDETEVWSRVMVLARMSCLSSSSFINSTVSLPFSK